MFKDYMNRLGFDKFFDIIKVWNYKTRFQGGLVAASLKTKM